MNIREIMNPEIEMVSVTTSVKDDYQKRLPEWRQQI